jgi:L-aspartate oxidase
MKIEKADVVIIGGGIAGLVVAELLSHSKDVILIAKEEIEKSNSYLAQGGIAASLDKDDSWKKHFIDTIEAGSMHNVEKTTRELVKNAPKAISQLVNLGVPFDRDRDNNLSLAREGGHKTNRIVHAGGDSTGRSVTEHLLAAIINDIRIHSHVMVYDLIVNDGRCVGVFAKNNLGETIMYQAPYIILATGGMGGLYEVTSNDSTITGDGIAMAYRAGCELVDLEFIQFHPTMLVTKNKSSALVSEAVRGEGARLVDENGRFIMDRVHQQGDLAPRDIVSRQVFKEQQAGHQIFLDISAIENFKNRFPQITALCKENGIKIANGLIPVTPGAHFIMGGVKTNMEGETSLPGLYAVGEVACNGVHGANRLASNSLLEGLIFAGSLASHLLEQEEQEEQETTVEQVTPHIANINNLPEITIPRGGTLNQKLPAVSEIRRIMTDYVGIVRNGFDLETAFNWFDQYNNVINADRLLISLTNEEKIITNMLTVGWLISSSALLRTESRGGHFRTDYPKPNDKEWLKHYIVRGRNFDE